MSDEIGVRRPLPTVTVGGFPTVSLTRRDLADVMVSDCMEARRSADTWVPRLVFSSNGQGIALAGRDASFDEAMHDADIVHADGQSVVIASKRTALPLPERICTTDFFEDALAAAAAHKLKFFFLGASEDQNAAAVTTIEKRYPDVDVVGRHHGYFGEDEDGSVCELVRESGADVLWVAMGKPHQEHWCVRNRERLLGVGWVKTCGGLYSYLAGDAPRAPQWVRSAGLEWLFRAMDDPKRLAWRYVTTNPYAFYRLMRYTERSGKQ